MALSALYFSRITLDVVLRRNKKGQWKNQEDKLDGCSRNDTITGGSLEEGSNDGVGEIFSEFRYTFLVCESLVTECSFPHRIQCLYFKRSVEHLVMFFSLIF